MPSTPHEQFAPVLTETDTRLTNKQDELEEYLERAGHSGQPSTPAAVWPPAEPLFSTTQRLYTSTNKQGATTVSTMPRQGAREILIEPFTSTAVATLFNRAAALYNKEHTQRRRQPDLTSSAAMRMGYAIDFLRWQRILRAGDTTAARKRQYRIAECFRRADRLLREEFDGSNPLEDDFKRLQRELLLIGRRPPFWHEPALAIATAYSALVNADERWRRTGMGVLFVKVSLNEIGYYDQDVGAIEKVLRTAARPAAAAVRPNS